MTDTPDRPPGGVAAVLRPAPLVQPVPSAPDMTPALQKALLRLLVSFPQARLHLRQATLAPVSSPEVMDQITPECFVCALEGASDVIGLAHLSASAAQALIELQTLGRILRDTPSPRRPTRTDAALAMPILSAFLSHLGGVVQSDDPLALLGGASCGAFLSEPRSAALVMDDRPFVALTCQLDLGDGDRTGQLRLIVQDRAAERQVQRKQEDVETRETLWGQTWPALIQQTEARLNSVLHRQTLTLAQLGALRVGDVLCLPDLCMESVMLETLTGKAIAQGRLGQVRGQRALRLTSQPGQNDDATAPALPPPPRSAGALILKGYDSDPVSTASGIAGPD